MKRYLRILLSRVKNNLYIQREIKKIIAEIEKNKDKDKIYFFQLPTHSNIGDHAISLAQIDFFKKKTPRYSIIEINQHVMTSFIKKYSKTIKPNDIICLHGGGNFGNEYMFEENLRRVSVKNFPNNKIIVFPQTIHYSDDDKGYKELKETQSLFKSHRDLTLTAREEVSYELMKKYFPNNNIILTPDIVLFMNKTININREYGLAVIRNDVESVLSEDFKNTILNTLKYKYDTVVVSDMHVDGYKAVKTASEREIIVTNKFREFSRAKLVVTDRLHGMVFSAITSTPCIALSNYNQKVSATYSWIKNLDYIKFVQNEEEFKEAFEQLSSSPVSVLYDTNMLEKMYTPLINAFKNV